jgi:hypothetical protein
VRHGASVPATTDPETEGRLGRSTLSPNTVRRVAGDALGAATAVRDLAIVDDGIVGPVS